MEDKYEKLAEIILNNVGGSSNILNMTHCITRLRFKLADESCVDTKLLSSTDGILSIMVIGEQYQIVIGPQVSEVYHAAKKLLNSTRSLLNTTI